MRAVSIFAASLSAGAVLGASACGNGDDRGSVPVAPTPADGGVDASNRLDATAGDATADAATSGDQDGTAQDAPEAEGEAAPTPTLALLRIANWSADSPGIDFCLAPHGTGAFQGPILGARADSIDQMGLVEAGTGALTFPQVSAYLLVDPAQYDARVVVAGPSADCSAGIVQDATSLPPLVTGGRETIALVGAANPKQGELSLRIVGFADELVGSVPGSLIVRVINTDVDLPKVEVGTLAMYLTPFTALPVNAGASSIGDPMADPNGYVLLAPPGANQVDPIANQVIAARTAAASSLVDASLHAIVAQAPNITLPAGLSVTFVVVGSNGQAGQGSGIAQLLECLDNAGTVGLEGTCHVISQ